MSANTQDKADELIALGNTGNLEQIIQRRAHRLLSLYGKMRDEISAEINKSSNYRFPARPLHRRQSAKVDAPLNKWMVCSFFPLVQSGGQLQLNSANRLELI